MGRPRRSTPRELSAFQRLPTGTATHTRIDVQMSARFLNARSSMCSVSHFARTHFRHVCCLAPDEEHQRCTRTLDPVVVPRVVDLCSLELAKLYLVKVTYRLDTFSHRLQAPWLIAVWAEAKLAPFALVRCPSSHPEQHAPRETCHRLGSFSRYYVCAKPAALGPAVDESHVH